MCVPDTNVAVEGQTGAETSAGGVSPAMGMMMVGQLASSYLAQQNAADLQKIRNDAAEKSEKAALRQDQAILIRRTQEERENFAQSNFDRQRRAMEIKATANVAAGEAGVGGIAVDRLLDNVDRQSGEVGVRSKKNFSRTLASLEDAGDKAVANMVNRIQGLPPVTQPNLLATAFNVATPYVASGAFDEYLETT